MSRSAPRLIHWLAFALILALPQTARAWVETAVRSHEARVEVARDGSAVVRHELVLKVRGGPMKSLEIGGVGTIGAPLPDAVVRRAVEGSSSAWPLTVSALEDGSLRLGIGAERGIRGGSYLFSFAYEVDLNELGRINKVDDGLEVSFIGPRLVSGVDSAKVTFVVPRGSSAPELGDQDDTGAGVLLGEVRRGADSDEVELIRAHLAIGEPAMWRIVVAPDALPDVSPKDAPGPVLSTSDLRSSSKSSVLLEPDLGRNYLPLAALLGLFFGLLAFFKAQLTVKAARLAEARVKPLLPGSPALRGTLVAASVAGATYLVLRQEPWMAMVCLSFAALASTHLLPVRVARPRGPGVWESIELPQRQLQRDLPGKIFETRSLVGFLAFATLVLGVIAAAYRILPESNYFALMVLSLVILVVPLFWTGRLRDLPQSPAEQARPWLKFARRAVDERLATVELWGRRSTLGDEVVAASPSLEAYDETRIRVLLRDVPQGLRALEISLDEAAGACVLPCIVIRALEDSPAVRALPSDIPWQRGRTAEERVAVLRPTAPTPSQLLRLLKTLMTNLRAAARYSSPGASALRSGGSADVTSNASSPSAEQVM